MINKFDELAKGLAQSVTRRQALKRFVGLAGMALACFGVANNAEAYYYNNCVKNCVHACLKNGGTLTYCQGTCELYCAEFP